MALSIRLGHDRSMVEIEHCRDRSALARRLEADRFNAAYALAQLDDDAWPLADFFRCRTPAGESIVCHSSGGLGNATTIAGPADAAAAILRLHPGFASTFAIADPAHVAALETVYRFRQITQMARMAVTRQTFRPTHGDAKPMLGAHVELVNRLYNTEGEPTHYRHDHIADGCYWGVVDEERLVAIAGTHAIGRSQQIAILGNVFTHPRYRGRGHGTTVTSAVSAALLEQVDEVVLSVNPENTHALQAYRKLGYRYVGDIIEASATRDTSTLLTTVRRWIARQRSADGSREVVST